MMPWLFGCDIGMFMWAVHLVGRLGSCFFGWLVDRWVGLLVGWCVGWSVGWLVV